ncbi:MAG: Ig domain-containing protein, partial [Myxococcota bacterium]
MRKILALISTLGGLAACGGDSVTPPAPMSDLVIASDAELMSGAEDQPFTSTLMATGGSGSGYRWSVIDGALPTNVFLTSSGTPETTISGTPRNNGRFSFTIEVRDDADNTASRAFTLNIEAAPPAVRIPDDQEVDLPEGATETPYLATITALDGSGAGYRWSLAADTRLPDGLALAADGITTTISGTPSEPGVFTFRLRVEDSAGDSDEETFTIIIQDSAPLQMQTRLLPNGRVS